MAESIAEYGLLENLVVREDPERPGCFLIVAGERRWRAIKVLIDDGRWFRQKKVPIVIIEGDGLFENLVENLGRKDVLPWELGHRFCEILEMGYTQKEVCARVHKSIGFVSRHVVIARGLDASTIDYFQKTNMHPSGGDLARIAALLKRDGSPDARAQLEAAKRLKGIVGHRRRRPRRRNLDEKDQVFMRYQRLQTSTGVPTHAVPYVLAVLRYLKGEDRQLRFKL